MGSIGKDLFIGGVVPGAAGGHFIAGTNAATAITTGLTAHIIGTVDTLTTYTGNTPQTGDAFARLGAAGAGLTALGDTRIANLDATISSRMATFTLPTRFSSLSIDTSGFVISSITGQIGGTIINLDALAAHGDSAWATATGFATPTNITAGTITTVTNLTNAPTAGDLTATMKASVTTAATAATPTAAGRHVSRGCQYHQGKQRHGNWRRLQRHAVGAGINGFIVGQQLGNIVGQQLGRDLNRIRRLSCLRIDQHRTCRAWRALDRPNYCRGRH